MKSYAARVNGNRGELGGDLVVSRKGQGYVLAPQVEVLGYGKGEVEKEGILRPGDRFSLSQVAGEAGLPITTLPKLIKGGVLEEGEDWEQRGRNRVYTPRGRERSVLIAAKAKEEGVKRITAKFAGEVLAAPKPEPVVAADNVPAWVTDRYLANRMARVFPEDKGLAVYDKLAGYNAKKVSADLVINPADLARAQAALAEKAREIIRSAHEPEKVASLVGDSEILKKLGVIVTELKAKGELRKLIELERALLNNGIKMQGDGFSHVVGELKVDL